VGFELKGLVAVAVVMASGAARAAVVETTSMREALAGVDAETLVAIDVDNTILEAAQAVGSDQWFSRVVADYRAQGVSPAEAVERTSARWQRVQSVSVVRAVEAETPSLIAGLQKRGVRVVALTARPLAARAETIRQLDDVGVGFAQGAADTPARACLRAAPDTCYIRGIIFVGSSDKGRTLVELMQTLGWTPKKVVFVDDKLHNTESVRDALDAPGALARGGQRITHTEFRYGAADAHVAAYQHELAQLQEALLERPLTDDEARLLLSARAQAAAASAATAPAAGAPAAAARAAPAAVGGAVEAKPAP
jgi:hypothetical protein